MVKNSQKVEVQYHLDSLIVAYELNSNGRGENGNMFEVPSQGL